MLIDRTILIAGLTALSLVALPVAADEEPVKTDTPVAAPAAASDTAPDADDAAKAPDAKADDGAAEKAANTDAMPKNADAKEADAKEEPKEADAKDTPKEADAKDEPKEADAKDAPKEADAKDEPKEAEAKEPVKTYITGDVVIGDPNAPLTVIEYASFTCPHCASFHVQTWPDVKKNYIDTGKVKFIMREVYFDEYGLWAAMVARCGGEAGYYPIVDTLLGQQASWTRSSDIVGSIIQIGRRAGLSKAQIEACLTDRDYAKTLIEAYQKHATDDEVRSTPTFMIGTEKATGAMGYEEFSKLLDAALADG